MGRGGLKWGRLDGWEDGRLWVVVLPYWLLQDILFQSLSRVSGPKWAQFGSTSDLPWSESSRQSQSTSLFLNEKEKWLSLISKVLMKKVSSRIYAHTISSIIHYQAHRFVVFTCPRCVSTKYIHSQYSQAFILQKWDPILSIHQPDNETSPPGLGH